MNYCQDEIGPQRYSLSIPQTTLAFAEFSAPVLYPPVQAPGLLILFWRSLESSDLVEKLQETVHPPIFLIMTVSITLSL